MDYIKTYAGQDDLLEDYKQKKIKSEQETFRTEQVLSNITNIFMEGTQIILEQVYDIVGFSQIQNVTYHILVSSI
ncbi:MAG: hypothetical protein LBH32_08460 [Dysgonamonadaceae bacterium]|jgi:hypothetical protein|nr:hypothetical protein [Dysgonamonadaceae bacterium]